MEIDYKKKLLYIIIALTLLLWMAFYFDHYLKDVNTVDHYLEDDKIYFVLNDEGSCSLDQENWVNTDESKACGFDYVDKIDTLYLKNKYGHETSEEINQTYSVIESAKISTSTIYLALGGKEQISYELEYKGHPEDKPELKSLDEKIATVSEDGLVEGKTVGQTKIELRYGDKKDSVDVYVTDIIILMPDDYDDYKPRLGCGLYTKEDNDFIDLILASRVEKAGYATRAGVVAAARFLGLEFPYHISYFVENGRIDSYVNRYCDGEGRYYHIGLFLDESRYDELNKDMIKSGPVTWGCSLYDLSYNRYMANGLDCSGFVSWAIHNGGFDCRDLGAGIAHDWPDLTDLGPKIWLADALDNGTLRTGDVLAGGDGGPSEGGHVAIVAGMKDGYYYVAEELGYRDRWGYFISKYNRERLLHYFYWQVDMNEFYGEDGNLTDYWNEG